MTDLTQLENRMVLDSYWYTAELEPYEEYDPSDNFDEAYTPPEKEQQDDIR